MTEQEMYDYIEQKVILLKEVRKVDRKLEEAKNDRNLSRLIEKEKADLLHTIYKIDEEIKYKFNLKENSVIPKNSIIGFTHDSKTFTTYYYGGKKEEVPCTDYKTYNISKFTTAFKQMKKFVEKNGSVRKDQAMFARWKKLVPYIEQIEKQGTHAYGYLIQNFDLLKANTSSEEEYDAYLKEFQEDLKKYEDRALF